MYMLIYLMHYMYVYICMSTHLAIEFNFPGADAEALAAPRAQRLLR